MNVKQWAAQGGVHPLPAYRWFRVGKLPVAQVSSADQRTDLDRQVARVTAWVTRDGGQVDQVVTEIGSALNGRHRKFLTLLCDPTADRIIVEHRDRFARFGAEYVEPADDLVRDVTEIMASLCTCRCGRRPAANRARKAVAALETTS